MKKAAKQKLALKVIWWGYIIALFLIVVIKFHGSLSSIVTRIELNSSPETVNYNLIPFRSIGAQVKHISQGWARYNLLGNIVPFMPFGFLLPLAFEKISLFKKVAGIGLIADICIEVFQYFSKTGSFDVDDIFLNMIGIVLGYWLMRGLASQLNVFRCMSRKDDNHSITEFKERNGI